MDLQKIWFTMPTNVAYEIRYTRYRVSVTTGWFLILCSRYIIHAHVSLPRNGAGYIRSFKVYRGIGAGTNQSNEGYTRDLSA